MKSRMIRIGDKMIGILGIDEVFRELLGEGREPSPDLKPELLRRLRGQNYIPEPMAESYAGALLEEYAKYCAGEGGEDRRAGRSEGTWRGIPREEIPWFPAVVEELCDGCRACLNFCPNRVYEWVEAAGKVRVSNPYACIVGCRTCASKCQPGAILFPPLEMLDSFRKGGSSSE